jgi:acyl-CoA hydrolase/RimJ/RimL family protein N-acetyltransferase
MEESHSKRVRAEDILKIIPPGSSVFVESGCGEPQYLVKKLIIENLHLNDVRVFTTIPLRTYSDFGGDGGARFRIHSFFLPPSIAGAFASGKADHIPLSSDMMDAFIRQGCIRINIAVIQLSRPDERGYMSLGVTSDILRTIIEEADLVVAQVNSCMPSTCGDNLIHMLEVDYLVEYDEPLIACPPEEPDPETVMIGERISRLVEDGSTIQVGFGRIPDTALMRLADKKDLSIHSEIITDNVVKLVESGAIPEGKSIEASLCLGSELLFRFIRSNPMVKMKPVTYMTDPQVILSKAPFIAINGAVEIDLTGQSCVSLNEQNAHLGALGHPLFNRVAQLSGGGKAIIALRSTSRDGTVSRIVPEFSDSRMGIVTTQTDISYVVTEYGSVNLFGRSIRERALALITIAHPKYRKWLMEEAKRLNYIFQDQLLPPDDTRYPVQYETACRLGEQCMLIRPVKITDERNIQNLFYSMSTDEKFHRFLMHMPALHHRQAQAMVNVDYQHSLGMVVESETGDSRGIIAVAHIIRDDDDEDRETCEFAVMVHPECQNQGIATFLLRLMVSIAPEMGFDCMRAYVWEGNTRMQRVFEKLGLPERITIEYHVAKIEIDLEDTKSQIKGKEDLSRHDDPSRFVFAGTGSTPANNRSFLRVNVQD